jgi:hypothetical protein
MIMKKTAKKAQAKLNAKFTALVTSAAAIGFNLATGYAAAVELVIAVKGSAAAMERTGEQYKRGYVARSLLSVPAYAKRWHNLDQSGQFEAAGEIIAKATPDSSKPDRRTEVEHKAVRAADVSWAKVKREAGIAPTKKGNRAPRTGSTGNVPPVDLVKASPKLATKEAANDYFGTAAAALLATVDKNAKLVDPRLSSAVSDFLAAVKKALGIDAK